MAGERNTGVMRLERTLDCVVEKWRLPWCKSTTHVEDGALASACFQRGLANYPWAWRWNFDAFRQWHLKPLGNESCGCCLIGSSSVNVFLARFGNKRKGKINQRWHVCTSFSAPKKILFDPSTKDVDALWKWQWKAAQRWLNSFQNALKDDSSAVRIEIGGGQLICNWSQVQ